MKETENFYVFRNRHEVAKIYQAKNVTYITGWEELIVRSRSEDITQSFYMIGNASNEASGLPRKRELEYAMKSPVEYELRKKERTEILRFCSQIMLLLISTGWGAY